LASTTHSLPTTLMTSASQSAIAIAPSGGGKSYGLVGCSLIQALAMSYPFYFPATALLQSSAKSKSFPSPTSRPRQPSPTLPSNTTMSAMVVALSATGHPQSIV
jgi:hypothetical protein